MASGKGKKSIDELLSGDVPQGPVKRGQGMHLSTVVHGQIAQEAQSGESAPPHNRISAPVRVSRGYKLRDDLVKQCKQIALDENRKLYEVMEEALERYVAWKQEVQK